MCSFAVLFAITVFRKSSARGFGALAIVDGRAMIVIIHPTASELSLCKPRRCSAVKCGSE